MFVGQRKDPFVVNLGEVFDLVNFDPLGLPDGRPDALANKNITSLVLELPIQTLTAGGQPQIGVWATASLRRTRILADTPSYALPEIVSGEFMQVSRLGMPLVNELVIGLPDKDRYNMSRPADDGQFNDYLTNPTLPELLEVLFGVQAPNLFPRADLDQVINFGFPQFTASGGFRDMLRLDTSTLPTPLGFQERLGLLAGDAAGFPNKRRPGDDVVDITLRVAMGALLPLEVAPAGQLPFTDGALVDDSFFDATFPYLRTPLPGSPSTACP